MIKKIWEAIKGGWAYLMIKIWPPKPKPVIPTTEKVSLLIPLAKAIQIYEGWYPSSSSFRHCNPGNVRSVDGSFMTFDTYQDGFNYLCDYIQRVSAGQHKAYPLGGKTTLQEFFNVYSPAADNNNPIRYASWVSKSIGVSVDTPLNKIV